MACRTHQDPQPQAGPLARCQTDGPQRRFSFRLLGTFDVLHDGRRLTELCHRKMRGLLAYLVTESAQMHSRQALAGLLWPERDEDHARQSLRQALTGLRAVLADEDGPGALLTVNRDTIGFNRGPHEVDIAAFDAALPAECADQTLRSRTECRQCHLVAAKRYRGPFLAGLSLPDAPEFESWLELKRERFARRASEMFGHLAACHEQSGEYALALRYARAQLRVDPWHEEAHRQVVRVLALGGSRNAALAHYRRMSTLLAEELGVEPEQTTRALYEAIRAGRLRPPALTPAERLAPRSAWDARACQAAPPGHAGERRLLTVLSAELRCPPDADPEALQQRSGRFVQTALQLLRRHGGAVCSGGNLELMAYFGYPEPCEQAALQAVRAALALHAALAGLQPRVRLHTGVVFVPPRLRGPCDPDFGVIGPTPRLARSLQAASPEVDVALSETTFAVVRELLHYRTLPGYRVPDASEPTALFEVRGLSETRRPERTRIVEPRLRELPRSDRLALAVREREGHALDRLGTAKPLAQLASNLGMAFSEAQLAQALRKTANLGRAGRCLADDLERLVKAGVLERWSGPGVLSGYRFRDPVLREVAYRSQSRAQRHLCRRLLGERRPAPVSG